MALNENDGGVPDPKPVDRDAPMSLEQAQSIAKAVSHRKDGTSQALWTLATVLHVTEEARVLLTERLKRNIDDRDEFTETVNEILFDHGVELGVAYKEIRELQTSHTLMFNSHAKLSRENDALKLVPESVTSGVKARCSACGHSDFVRIDSDFTRRELKRCFDMHAMRHMMKLFWRGWLFSFCAGLSFGWFAWRFWEWL